MPTDDMRKFVFIYARTDSRRFPRKVLTPLWGRALIDIVCDRALRVPAEGYALLTSDRPVDDALALHVEGRGIDVVRGDADDLVKRTVQAINETGATLFLRVNADSPLFEPSLAEQALGFMGDPIFVSNLFNRKFPYGVAVEWLGADFYKGFASCARSDELEHVTKHLYRLGSEIPRWSIEQDRDDSELTFALDTQKDHSTLESLNDEGDIRLDAYWKLLGLKPPVLRGVLLSERCL